MNIVLPMAGLGTRFSAVGVTTPKPLISVRGRPMYSWAADGLPLESARQIIFLCLAEHLASGDLEADIHERYGEHRPRIVPVSGVTRGQACTVLLAREWIDNAEPLLIFNADTYCPTTLATLLAEYDQPPVGVLDVFEAPGSQWSFVRCDPAGRVLETAEKRRISGLASTGLYYFGRGQDFVRHADAAVAENETTNNEFYVAPLYNRLIAEGAEVLANHVDEVWALGTPEDLARFNREYPQ